MNWDNFDRLVAHLQNLIVTAPQQFNYSNGFKVDEDGGCVDCHCRLLMGVDALAWFTQSRNKQWDAIRIFLGCSEEEAHGLWRPHSFASIGHIYGEGSRAFAGADGIREVLRRLAVLATRYERPASQPVLTSADRETAFLESLRADLSAVQRGATV